MGRRWKAPYRIANHSGPSVPFHPDLCFPWASTRCHCTPSAGHLPKPFSASSAVLEFKGPLSTSPIQMRPPEELSHAQLRVSQPRPAGFKPQKYPLDFKCPETQTWGSHFKLIIKSRFGFWFQTTPDLGEIWIWGFRPISCLHPGYELRSSSHPSPQGLFIPRTKPPCAAEHLAYLRSGLK